jgi:type IV pilus assembly protein PilM
MMNFFKRLSTSTAPPIGVDVGTTAVRVAQTEVIAGDLHLTAAGEASLPDPTPASAAELAGSLDSALRAAMGGSSFRGRSAHLSLPAAWLHMRHIRVPITEAANLDALALSQCADTMPFAGAPTVRTQTVCNLTIDGQEMVEAIALFAPADSVAALLRAAEHARLEVRAMHPQPRVLAEFFHKLYRRKADDGAVTFHIDIGRDATRAVVAYDGAVRFARSIAVGGRKIQQTIAKSIGMTESACADFRQSIQPPDTALNPAQQTAYRDAITALADELDLCRRYHDATFADRPVSRILFSGGPADDRHLCQHLASQLMLPAQLADPMVRIKHVADNTTLSGDRIAQPAWSIAVGLSLLPQLTVPQKAAA